MRLNTISDLRKADEQAVIINVGTKLAATLALLSALRYAEMPVLLIDCDSKDGSLEHFSRMMELHQFDLLSAPQRKHGHTLDWLFSFVQANKVLLIDSDAEILGSEIITMMKSFIDDENTFGSGFVNGPAWLTDQTGLLKNAYYQERPWMPLTMLKVHHVREALQQGLSFIDRLIYNDFSPSNTISVHIYNLKKRYPWIMRWYPSWMDIFKNTYYGHRPSLVYCDTGADIYQYLRYKREYVFVGFPGQFHERYVTHFFGLTRASLLGDDTHGRGTSIHATVERIRRRLQDAYGRPSPE